MKAFRSSSLRACTREGELSQRSAAKEVLISERTLTSFLFLVMKLAKRGRAREKAPLKLENEREKQTEVRM